MLGVDREGGLTLPLYLEGVILMGLAGFNRMRRLRAEAEEKARIEAEEKKRQAKTKAKKMVKKKSSK